jgi:hypothetical protein
MSGIIKDLHNIYLSAVYLKMSPVPQAVITNNNTRNKLQNVNANERVRISDAAPAFSCSDRGKAREIKVSVRAFIQTGKKS